ncbi:MAG: HD domain-containing protein [Anaerovibrio sp.]|uniref:HD domain-containing protein n=1 Tax=Anaerovibrio sp. TaxID=1872532 RepID=UPI0025F6FA4E|nr:HD domain-containing protein [Anaerovibrio sp.]MCR5176573.1 HD domain-containing protein [Anaerovibrio sp.]
MLEKDFAQQVIDAGGRLYIVGGWVRDRLMGKVPHDKDFVVVGLSKEKFVTVFTDAKLIGKSFPVFLMEIDGVKCEVAFARKEHKAGKGYKGFDVEYCDISIEEDLFRRDTTVNSIAMDVATGNIIDPYGGQQDIKAMLLRPVSEHFGEDPVRALRAARQAAQMDFSVSEDLLAAMRQCREEIVDEPAERVFSELKKVLETKKPSIFFQLLRKAGLLEVLFPEINALIGKTQPVDFHPEGDAYNHTMEIIDRIADGTTNVVPVFAGLVHDIGKGTTPMDMLPHHYDHEKRGLEVMDRWNKRMRLPKVWVQAAKMVISHHMRAPLMRKPGKITELVLFLHDMEKYLAPKDFCRIIMADHGSLPVYLEKYDDLLQKLLRINGTMAPAEKKGTEIGEWLLQKRTAACVAWLANNSNGENFC